MSLDAPDQAPVTVGHALPRRYVAVILIVVAVLLVAALVVIRDHKAQNSTTAVETYNPAPASIIAPLTQIPAAVVDAVGVTAPDSPLTPPKPTGSTSIWRSSANGGAVKPVVFFYGAEFAPYAAAERWPFIVALSRFGTFGPVGLMQSSQSVAFAGTSTFTFSHTTFASRWIDLQTVERYSSLNPTGARYTVLQTPTRAQALAVAAYDPSASTFALVDVANRYALVGSSFSPSVLDDQSQGQIVADLSAPASPVTQAIVASANEITAAVCTVTADQPASACHARGVQAADAKLGIAVATGAS